MAQKKTVSKKNIKKGQLPQSKKTKQAKSLGRKAVITKENVLTAALSLLGPHKSISQLSLREIARKADIAPNSFYRHFESLDDLNLALIDLAGKSLRKLLGEARHRVSDKKSVVRTSIEAFMDMLYSEERHLHILLREGNVGSTTYKAAVEKELHFFQEELCLDLIRLLKQSGNQIKYPDLAAQAITRLVFAYGGLILDKPLSEHDIIKEDLIKMVRMILIGGVKI